MPWQSIKVERIKMIELIENTILTALRDKFPQSEVKSFPVDFEKYQFTSYDSCILVRFENSDISNQTSITRVNADETYNFTVFISKRYCKKHSDSYQFLHDIKKVLNGLQIMSKRLILSNRKFEEEIDGDLWYSYSVKVTLPLTDEHKDLSVCGKTALKIIH